MNNKILLNEMNKTTKPVVQFSRKAGVHVFGNTCMLKPINHPDSSNVSNTKHVITSGVIKVTLEHGRIIAVETQNTIYTEYDDGEYIEIQS